jgi:hypothetical protein
MTIARAKDPPWRLKTRPGVSIITERYSSQGTGESLLKLTQGTFYVWTLGGRDVAWIRSCLHPKAICIPCRGERAITFVPGVIGVNRSDSKAMVWLVV